VVNKMKGHTWENSSRLDRVDPKYLKCQRSRRDKNTPIPRLITNAVKDKGAWLKRASFCSIIYSILIGKGYCILCNKGLSYKDLNL